MHYLKYIIFVLTMMSVLRSSAQGVELQILNSASVRTQFLTNDLVQFIISSTATEEQKIYVEISVDRANSGLVNLMKSPTVTLEGLSTMSGINLWTSSGGVKLIRSQTGFERAANLNFQYPAGKYQYCISVFDEEAGLLTQSCIDFELENILSLQLIYPLDDQPIEEEQPTFSWTPVFSSQLGQVRYNVRWVEIDKDPDSEGAFFNLPAFLALKKEPFNYLFYNQKYPSFDRDKTYLWQVQAISNNIVIAESEIWSYYFEDPSKEDETVTYVKLSKSISNPIHRFSGKTLAFEWENQYEDRPLQFEIFDHNDKKLCDQDNYKMDIAKHGDNFYQIKLGKYVRENQRYKLIVYGPKKSYELAFISL